MQTPAVRRGLIAAAVLALALVVLTGVALIPNSLRPAAEHVLAAQVAGGKAHVDRVETVWFGADHAVGLRLSGVTLDDGKGRPVLRARLVETGLGADSLMVLAPGPSHLVLKDFFVASSVSSQGLFALGYDAAGPPPKIDLGELILGLTGKRRRDRPLSYVRYVDLERGVLTLRQVGGPLAWKARVARVAFDKGGGNFAADARLMIDDGLHLARVNGQAKGRVGLKALSAGGAVADLVPARIFPAVGITRPLSALDAPVAGKAEVDYAADRGITVADVSGRAGAGLLRVGRLVQPMQGAELVTVYDPAAKQVVLQTFRLEADRTRLDVGGRFWLVPERRGAAARIEYRLASATSLMSVAPSATPQHLTGLTLSGAMTPEAGRLEVNDLRVMMEGAPVRLTATLYRGRDRRASPGIKADIVVGGVIGTPPVFAFWPEQIAAGARDWLVPRLKGARVTNASIHADIPPGQLDRHRLENPQLRIAFAFTEGQVKVAPTLPGIEHAVGHGVVQGDRLDLVMTSGQLAKLALSEGSVTVPRFKPKGALAVFKARAVGDLGDMLRLVDTPPLGMMGPTGMDPSRLSGPADLMVTITRPMLRKVRRADYGVRYVGRLSGAVITDVVLGVDLVDGDMAVDGGLDHVNARGTGRVGPFNGKVAFKLPLTGADAGRKYIDLDGKVSFVGAEGAPFKAMINTRFGIGGAKVRSRVFQGQARWRKGEAMSASGYGEAAALRLAGLPVGAGVPARIPLNLAMTSSDGVWSGALDADAYSGALTYSKRDGRMIRYAAEITPDEARRMGAGKLPMFSKAQTVSVNIALQDLGGSADYAAGPLGGRLDWSAGKTRGELAYGFKTTLDNADLAALGVPVKLGAPVAVQARGVARGGAVSGQAEVAGALVRYDMSAPQGGARQIALSGTATDQTFARLGVDLGRMMDGPLDFSGKLTRTADGAMTGRLEGDFARTALRVPDSGWSKPAGQKARGALDVAVADGILTLRRITAEGPGLEISGTGAASPGKLAVNLPTARLDGFFDGAVRARQDDAGLEAIVVARYLDLRPILKQAQRAAGQGDGAGQTRRIQLDAAIARVRINETGYVKDVKLSGGWGAVDQRRMTLSAATLAGAALEARAYPDKGATALSLKVADLGDVAKELGGYDNLRGGVTTGTGRIVEGGYDFAFEIDDLTILRVPGAAELLATNGAIQFDRMIAPMEIRGSTVTLGDVRAAGKSVGLTARGVMDTKTRTLDVVGVVTPAYALNAALGGVFGSRDGEGLFGITYAAKGPFTAPKITINPMSLVAPGILRRMFEGVTPTAPEPHP